MLRYQLFPAIGTGVTLRSLRRSPFGITLPEGSALTPPFLLRQRETLAAGTTDVYPLAVSGRARGQLELSLSEYGILDVVVLEDGVSVLEETCWGEFLHRSFAMRPGHVYELRLTNPSEFEVRYDLGVHGLSKARARETRAA